MEYEEIVAVVAEVASLRRSPAEPPGRDEQRGEGTDQPDRLDDERPKVLVAAEVHGGAHDADGGAGGQPGRVVRPDLGDQEDLFAAAGDSLADEYLRTPVRIHLGSKLPGRPAEPAVLRPDDLASKSSSIFHASLGERY